MDEVVIRPLKLGDLGQWRSLWDGYNAFYGRSGVTALPDDVTAATWLRLHDSVEPVHGLVAELDGRLVGIAHYILHRSTTMVGLNCYLQDLFTSQATRGRGVGRALVEGVCGQAKAQGLARVYWQTHESNAAAQALYDRIAERSGFIVYRKML